MDGSDDHRLAGMVRELLTALIRSAILSDERDAAPFREEALRLHDRVRAECDPAGLAQLRIDGLWTMAVKAAQTEVLDDHPLQVSRRLRATSPVTLGDLVEPGLAFSALEERIRQAAATG